MSGADYYDCDFCGAGKLFYDANVDWDSYGDRIGQIRCICNKCYSNGIRLVMKTNKKDIFVSENNPGVHYRTIERQK